MNYSILVEFLPDGKTKVKFFDSFGSGNTAFNKRKDEIIESGVLVEKLHLVTPSRGKVRYKSFQIFGSGSGKAAASDTVVGDKPAANALEEANIK